MPVILCQDPLATERGDPCYEFEIDALGVAVKDPDGETVCYLNIIGAAMLRDYLNQWYPK